MVIIHNLKRDRFVDALPLFEIAIKMEGVPPLALTRVRDNLYAVLASTASQAITMLEVLEDSDSSITKYEELVNSAIQDFSIALRHHQFRTKKGEVLWVFVMHNLEDDEYSDEDIKPMMSEIMQKLSFLITLNKF